MEAATSETYKQLTCRERIRSHYESTMTEVRAMLAKQRIGGDDARESDIERWKEDFESEDWDNVSDLFDYGLSFDYVKKGTFKDQRVSYFRWQLSWGGPSSEFRFYVDADLDPYKIEYWFLDWFDGAHVLVRGGDLTVMRDVWNEFEGVGCVESARNER